VVGGSNQLASDALTSVSDDEAVRTMATTGWSRLRAGRHVHDSGAQVFHTDLTGSTWTAKASTGEQSNGHASMQAAIRATHIGATG